MTFFNCDRHSKIIYMYVRGRPFDYEGVGVDLVGTDYFFSARALPRAGKFSFKYTKARIWFIFTRNKIFKMQIEKKKTWKGGGGLGMLVQKGGRTRFSLWFFFYLFLHATGMSVRCIHIHIFKLCKYLWWSLFLYFNNLVSVTAGGPASPRGQMYS